LILSLIGERRPATQYITHFRSLWLKKPSENEAKFNFEGQDGGASTFLALRDALIRLSYPEGPTQHVSEL